MTLKDLERLKAEGKIQGYVDTSKSSSKNGLITSKYGNKKTVLDGITFMSKREATYYYDLKTRLLAKEISDLKLQVVFQLSVCKYIADFVYYENGERVVVDVKGYRTKEYKMKKKMMAKELNIEIKEV